MAQALSFVDRLAHIAQVETTSPTLSCFRITRRTRLCIERLLKILAALLQQRNTFAWCQRWTVSWRQLATSFEDVMATYHPPGIAEEVGCTSSNTQWAFPTSLEGIRCRPHPRDLTSMFMTIGDADTLCHLQLLSVHPLASNTSAPSDSSGRSKEWNFTSSVFIWTHFVVLPCHQGGRDYASRNSSESSSLSFGRETHVPCVGPASPPESKHSGPSWASQGSDWSPLRGHIIHLVLTTLW